MKIKNRIALAASHRFPNNAVAQNLFITGAQWMSEHSHWRKYRDEKPRHMQKVVVHYLSLYPSGEWKEVECLARYDKHNDVFDNENWNEITETKDLSWMPI